MEKKTYSKTRKQVAKGILAFLGIVLAISMVISTSTFARETTTYPETGIITAIDFADDYSGCLLEIIVANGNIFEYYSEDCDWWYNDLVSMIMDDMGTELVYDDEIIMIQYSGRLEHFEQWVVPEEE